MTSQTEQRPPGRGSTSPPTPTMADRLRSFKGNLLPDFAASLVVFLVALPLCVGVAVASGAPAELGIITGIVGGLVAGSLPGSGLQVSGPAAGLTVLVADAIARHGLPALGVLVVGAGLIQLILGLLKLGSWFQAISPSVVQGMLAGIGLVLIIGQLYPLIGAKQPQEMGDKLLQLPGLVTGIGSQPGAAWSAGLGAFTLAVMILWPKLPKSVRAVPAPLVAVLSASVITGVFALPVARIEVGSLADALNFPGQSQLGLFLDPAILGSILTIAIVASAESMFSAAAVDRMHDGPPTKYNAELVAQGTGNVVSGVFGAMPMTAVIVRSAANVQAGARTKMSRILHGVWLLLFAVLLPDLLNLVPLSALAALLVHAGWKLVDPKKLVKSAKHDRAEAMITGVTAVTIFGIDMLTGVLIGLGLAIALAAWRLSHITVDWHREDHHVQVKLRGNATFLRLPQILRALEEVPHARYVELDLTGVRHLDQATQATLEDWAAQRTKADSQVSTALPQPVP
ncbi:SulP family inorganic anion transporter [Pseudonocardia spinosispora]|uniref:SulP family inorganic anion transporter n=1 Tax=Pseudonocardia spinosispora TaxID=103441 RepID=UPI0005639585|nr:SulP family inorganic anion transporter [Pseudonocardia spinosispora]